MLVPTQQIRPKVVRSGHQRSTDSQLWKSKSIKSQPLGKAVIQRHDTNHRTEYSKVTSTVTCEWNGNAVDSKAIIMTKNTALLSWRAKRTCKLICFFRPLGQSGGKCEKRVEGNQRTEFVNDASSDWKARGRCSLPPYARRTDRQVDTYGDRWMMQRLQHRGKRDQMSTARWTRPWPGIQMLSHIYHHTAYERTLFPDEPCSRSAVCTFILLFFFFFACCVIWLTLA